MAGISESTIACFNCGATCMQSQCMQVLACRATVPGRLAHQQMVCTPAPQTIFLCGHFAAAERSFARPGQSKCIQYVHGIVALSPSIKSVGHILCTQVAGVLQGKLMRASLYGACLGCCGRACSGPAWDLAWAGCMGIVWGLACGASTGPALVLHGAARGPAWGQHGGQHGGRQKASRNLLTNKKVCARG